MEADLNTAEVSMLLPRVMGSQIKPWAQWHKQCAPYSKEQLQVENQPDRDRECEIPIQSHALWSGVCEAIFEISSIV